MQVFIFDLRNVSDEKLNMASQLLSATERQRLANMISVKRQKEFILGHFLLRQQLADFLQKPIDQINVLSSQSGALFLPDFPSVFVSLSHSFEYLAIAICNKPVGVDIQKMKPRDDFNELLNQIDSSEKAQELMQQGVKLSDAFYHLWTRKEALYKLRSLTSTNTPFFHYFLYLDFMLCVASESEDNPEWIISPVKL